MSISAQIRLTLENPTTNLSSNLICIIVLQPMFNQFSQGKVTHTMKTQFGILLFDVFSIRRHSIIRYFLNQKIQFKAIWIGEPF